MNKETKRAADFDEPMIWIYDPRFPAATSEKLAEDPFADFNRPMMIVDKAELAELMKRGQSIEFV